MYKPSKLRTYLMLAVDAGLCPDQILKGSGACWSDIEALKPFELNDIANLFTHLAKHTPPNFAITSAYNSKVCSYGIVGFATMSMPTLRDALQHWSRYCLIAGDPLITQIVEDGEEWLMYIEPRLTMSPEAERYCLEAAIAAVEPVIEELTNEPANTQRIDFSFKRPAWDDAYGLFRTKQIFFDRKNTVYYGKRSDLDRPIMASDGTSREIFHQKCDQFLSELTHSRTLAERLLDLMQQSSGELPSINEMAVALNMSRRSLQRGLQEEGISYQHLVKDFRVRHAKILLGEKRANIKTIAFMLGFKDVGSFRRAFRQWTGESVGNWQKSK